MGLAVGMAACLLIFSYVRFELSYDNFNVKKDRIYRVVTDIKTPSETINTGITSPAYAPNLKNDFPEVLEAARVLPANFLVQKDNQKYQEDNVMMADPSVFKVFSFPIVKGNPDKVLEHPFDIVLTETSAKKYFGSEDPVGKPLLLDGVKQGMVTGVMKDIPDNSHFKADMFVSMISLERGGEKLSEAWGNFSWRTYLLLPENYNYKQLQAKLPGFIKKHIGIYEEKNRMYYTLTLEPLKSVYLYSTYDAPEKGNLSNIYIFSLIAVFILFIACINFINLTTARASERAKEVGIRKVAGALRSQLTFQFLTECILLCFIAFLLSLLIAACLVNAFNSVSGKVIIHGVFQHPGFILVLFLISLVIGAIAGLYPAFVLSSYKPVAVLKGSFTSGSKGVSLRKILVVTQFTLSVILIISTIVVYKQLNYMRNQPLGFNKDQMLVVDFRGDSTAEVKSEIIKNEFKNIPNVRSVSFSSGIPGGNTQGAYSQLENKQGELQAANLDMFSIDFDFLNQFQIKPIAGRGFSKDMLTDSSHALIVNEVVVKNFGYSSPEEIIGKKYNQWGKSGVIVGVIKNFHYRSLKSDISPLVFRVAAPDDFSVLTVNVKSDNMPATIAALENKWNKLMPQRPFNYYFADEEFNKQYRGEERFGKLFLYFAVLAIFISCLGLLGLAAYSTIKRKKEIGIRKVLGASVTNITALISKDFIVLVFTAIIIASPIAWFIMDRWLRDFAFKINIAWWIFVLAGAVAIIIALATVSAQAIKAAIVNPVKSLRTE